MAKTKKEPLKKRNAYAYYRNGYVGCKLGKWTSIIVPFVAIFIAKFDDYIMLDDGTGGAVKLSLGCVLAMTVGGVAIWKETKKETQNSELTGVLGWAVAWALCYFFQALLTDLTLIMGCALAGQLAGLGFEIGAKNREYYMKEYRSANIQSNATAKAFKSVIGKKEEIPYE